MPDPQVVGSTPPVEYLPSPLFDWNTNDFVRDGSGHVVMADGCGAWVQWCVKFVLTERLAHIIYTAAYGTDLEEISQLPDPIQQQMRIMGTISAALTANPRTPSVGGFQFTRVADAGTVSFEVADNYGQRERSFITLSRG